MTVTGVRRAGDRAAVLDVEASPAAVAAGLRSLAASLGVTLVEVVPGAATVLVCAVDTASIIRLVAALPQLEAAPEDRLEVGLIELPARYDGPDLQAVADAAGMTTAEVVDRHSRPTYLAAFTGFAPGFAYLTGLDPRLQLARRSSPRPAVPAGSLAIADTYTAVYPRASPGGWHLIGTTEAVLFDPERQSPALLTPGAQVRFVPS
jgi:KipI family sensor histidine kinase inhibitor